MEAITLLLFLMFMLNITNQISSISYSYIFSDRLLTETILQQYQGRNPYYWIHLVKDQYSTKIRWIYFKPEIGQSSIKELDMNNQIFKLKAFAVDKLNCFVIQTQNQKNLTVFKINENSSEINKFYEVDPKLIPNSNNQLKISISSQCHEVIINQKLINYGNWSKYDGWKYILTNSPQFSMIVSQSGIFTKWNGATYVRRVAMELSQQYECQTYFDQYFKNNLQYMNKYIVFCYIYNQTKGSSIYNWFVKSYIQQYYQYTLLDQLSGYSAQIPTFQVSPSIQNFVITGRYPNSTLILIIKSINYIDLVFQDVNIPSTLFSQKMIFQFNQFHLYARNSTIYKSKYGYLFFSIMNNELVLLQQSYLTRNQVQNLISTFIIYISQEQNSSQMVVSQSRPIILNYYRNLTHYFMTFQAFQSLKDSFLKQTSKLNSYQFDSNLDFDVYKDIFQTKLVYAKTSQYQVTQDSTPVNKTKTQFVLTSFLLNLTVKNSVDGDFSIIDISKNSDYNCILARSNIYNDNTLVTLMFNSTSKQLKILQRYQYDTYDLKVSGFSWKVLVTDKCQVIYDPEYNGQLYYGRQLWHKKNNQISPIFIDYPTYNYFFLKNAQFDKSYKYAVYSLNQRDYTIFQYDGQNGYIQIFNQYDILYPYNIINVNQEQNKIVIVSIKQVEIPQNDDTNYYTKIIVFQKIQNSWYLMFDGLQTILASRVDNVKYSSNFQIFIYLQNQKSVRKLAVIRINYLTNQVTNIANSSSIISTKYYYKYTNQQIYKTIYFEVSNNYLYIRNITHQFLLKISPSGYNQIILQNLIDIAYVLQANTLYSVIIKENDNSGQQFNLLYLIEKQSFPRKETFISRTKANDKYIQKIFTNLRGIVYDDKNDKLYQCSPGCQYCVHRKYCIKCSPGYYLVFETKLCKKCKLDCKVCSQLQPNMCLQCYPNFVLEDQTCKRCNSKCLQCSLTSQTKCLSCSFGKSLISTSKRNKTCIQCPGNCSYCQETTKCKQCETGYTVDSNGICVACPLSCNKCNPSALSYCLQCKLGFYAEKSLNPNENITCKRCSDYCKRCNSSTVCLQCDNFYLLKSIISNQIISKVYCVARCSLPCKDCNQKNSTQCISCVQGYVYNNQNKSCDFDLSCNKQSNCIICPYEYNLIENRCYACKTTPNCDSCDVFNFSLCLTCKKGYYLSHGECAVCSSQCLECIFDDICTKCAPGYILPVDTFASRCFPCSSNCKTCAFTPANCLSCNQNMELLGSRCISSINIDFNLTLDYDYKAFTNADFQGIINEICKKTGKSRYQVTIASVKPGSVFILGNVLVYNQQDQTLTLKTLRLSFAEGSVVDGKKISASSFVGALVEPSTQTQSSINIGLIIGIVIPVTAVLIIIIAFIVYRVKKSDQQQNNNNDRKDDATTQSGASQRQRQKRRLYRAAKRKSKNLPQTQKSTIASSEIVPPQPAQSHFFFF